MSYLTRCFVKPAALIFFLSFSLQAKQEQTTVLRDLVVQVARPNAPPFEFHAFAGGGGGSTSNFKRIPEWKPAANEANVTSVNFKIDRKADLVIVQLILHMENEREVLAATYRLRENEKVRTEEVTKFGVEPLELTVVKAAKSQPTIPTPSIQPRIVNKTRTLEVVGFFKEPPPSETYRLTLKNASTRKIMAVDLFMPASDGNGGDGLRSHGAPGSAVMRPGDVAVHFIHVEVGGRLTANGLVPEAQLQRTLLIRTVVFDDGTYDGEVGPAAEMDARQRGQDMQRKRIIRLLQRAISDENQQTLITVNNLKEGLYALGKTADPSVVDQLMARYPSLNESRVWFTENVEEGLSEGKREFLRHLKEFEDTQTQDPAPSVFQKWLQKTEVSYENLTKSLQSSAVAPN